MLHLLIKLGSATASISSVLMMMTLRRRTNNPEDRNESPGDLGEKRVFRDSLLQRFLYLMKFISILILALSSLMYISKRWKLNKQNPNVYVIHDECNAPRGVDLVGAYGNLGNFHRVINTNSDVSQALFNQGLIHTFGYNTIEGHRNFLAALEFDPQCLMCYVGLVLTHGPNINTIMSEKDYLEGSSVVEKGLTLISRNKILNEIEKDIFFVHAAKFPKTIEEWRENGQAHYERLYSKEIEKLAQRFPEDPDLLAWCAESLINLSPWHYFNDRKEIEPDIEIALVLLRRVFSMSPNHLLALHLLIHIYEQSPYPQQGEIYADTLATISAEEGTTHLVHMPAHLYFRVGRYDDCVASSLRAVGKDYEYMSRCFQPYVPLHNRALLIFGAMASGNAEVALKYSIPAEELPKEGSIYVTALFPTPKELILTRFGRWSELFEVLAVGATSSSSEYSHQEWSSGAAVRHWIATSSSSSSPPYIRLVRAYTLTLALVASKHIELAKSASVYLGNTLASFPPDFMPSGHVFYSYRNELGAIMNNTAQASIALAEGDPDQAIELLREAVPLQDSFLYMEPEHHYLPIRQCLAAVLATHGRSLEITNEDDRRSTLLQEAIAVYKKDLEDHPNNVWALRGLHALYDSPKEKEAASLEFNRFWRGNKPMLGSCCELSLC